jgi:protein-disulfide isomerase
LNLEGFQMLGAKNAPITMVEFTDYQCPYCRQFHLTVFNELKKNFIDTGKVRFYSRDLPLDTLHPNAIRAAEAARCAADQGQFWTMRNVMGANPDKLDMDHLAGFATDLKLDTFAFRNCVESEKYKSAVQSDVLEATKIGAQATPSFVIGKSTPEGVDGELMIGALPYPSFEQKLKQLEAK